MPVRLGGALALFLAIISCHCFAAAGPHAASDNRSAGHDTVSGPRISFNVGKLSPREVNHVVIGEEVVTRVKGLRPSQEVTLRARWGRCQSSAVFRANERGEIDLSRDAPASGTYRGADVDGLFWSMKCRKPKKDEKKDDSWEDPGHDDISFELESGGERIARASLRRSLTPPGVEAREVREGGIVGSLYKPKGQGPFPAVLVLGGSEGGIPRDLAAYLASRGYAALALGYFKEKGLPKELDSIPLEYFEKGIAWMKKQSVLDTRRLAAVGCSRGGELALLLGSRLPAIHAVAAVVPSGVVWPGLSTKSKDPVPAWTSGGKPLPYVAGDQPFDGVRKRVPGVGEVVRYTPAFEKELENREKVRAATIPVEKIPRVMLIAAADDGLWPSERLSRIAWKRLEKSRDPKAHEIHVIPSAGHTVAMLPGYPTGQTAMPIPELDEAWEMGGTPEGNGRGQRATARLLDAFLEKATKR